MKRTVLLLFILATPVLAAERDPTVTTKTEISQTQSLSEWQMHGSSVPGPEEVTAQAVAALSSARAASIAASQAWYQWDKGAAAERDMQLERLRELTKKWQTIPVN
jgi:hypothetical protein